VSRAWRQLAAHYPDAKVVLSVRDPGRWWDSMDKDRRDGRAAGDRVLLAVEDEGFGPEPIRFREQPARVAGGWGLRLVDGLSDSWGARRVPGRTLVWMERRLPRD
jgi:Sulfotransferase domain